MRKLALAAVFGFGACGGGAETGTTLSGTQLLDRVTLEDGEYYMDYSVADTPLLAEEVRDWDSAVRVRLLVGKDFVAGARLPDGSPLSHRIEGAWRATPASAPAPAPGSSSATGTRPVAVAEAEEEEPDLARFRPDLIRPVDPELELEVWVVWEIPAQLTAEEVEQLTLLHPGCL
jgi:hypothetical protein